MTASRPASRGFASAAVLLALCLAVAGCGSGGRRGEDGALVPPPADSVRTFEHPSDDGLTINLEWGRSESEAEDVYYVVEIASEADHRAGRYDRVARVPSLKSLKSDEKRFYDFDDHEKNVENRDLHYVAVQPTKAYRVDEGAIRSRVKARERAKLGLGKDDKLDPKAQAKIEKLAAIEVERELRAVSARPYYLRVAIVRVEKKERAAPPRVEKEKEPVLAVAQKRSAQLLALLKRFDGLVGKQAQRVSSDDPPTIVKASYLRSLSNTDSLIDGAINLHHEYVKALRDLEEARASEGRDLKRELEEWKKRQAEAEKKAKEEREKKEKDESGEESTRVYVMEGSARKAIQASASLPPLVRPDPAGFRASDRPSDDGTTVAVEWPRSPSENSRTTYVVEIAKIEDGKVGEFKEAAEVPSLGAGKADQPKFFGFAPGNKKLHYAGVDPSGLFLDRKDRKAIRKEVVESELTHMPSSWTPDSDFATEVKALKSVLPDYLEGVRSINAALQALDGPLLPRLEELAGPFRAGLARYRTNMAVLKRFESHMAKRVADRVTETKRRLNRQDYAFRLSIRRVDETLFAQEAGSAKVVTASARPNYRKGYKTNNLAFSLVFCAIVMAFIQIARRNPDLFIRKIAGLEAVEEAIGRATEMGRCAFFVHGLNGMGSLSTIAAVNILGRVARRAAEYDTRVRVMNRDPIVMAVSQEVVKQSYTEAGRPDAYNDDDVALVAYDQFSYVAAVGGRMVRERPAAIFLMGYFYAESLLLAETGASTGAIQIAGTDSYTQIPFFITTCDYTLIGEELYAASAYLSREARMLGSLRGQDVGKAFLMLAAVLFGVVATVGHEVADALPGVRAAISFVINTLFQPF